MKTFSYASLPFTLQKIKTENIDGKRYYITPEGNKYPSVTTFLSSFSKPRLEEWIKRVGKEEAEKKSKKAAQIGEQVHSLIEQYISNKNIYKLGVFPTILSYFNNIKEEINNIDNIHFIEAALYSDRLKLGGRTDVIGEYKNKLSIIDFKTSEKEKDENWIEDYFLQTTAYAEMYKDLTKIHVPQIVIINTCNTGMSRTFVASSTDYRNKLLEKLLLFYGDKKC